MSVCVFCNRPGGYAVRTGVTAYSACHGCAQMWDDSDHSIEALQELRARGAALQGQGKN